MKKRCIVFLMILCLMIPMIVSAQEPEQTSYPLDQAGRFSVIPIRINYSSVNSGIVFTFVDTLTGQFKLAQTTRAGTINQPLDKSEYLPSIISGAKLWMIQVDPRALGTAGYCFFAYQVRENNVWMDASCDQ